MVSSSELSKKNQKNINKREDRNTYTRRIKWTRKTMLRPRSICMLIDFWNTVHDSKYLNLEQFTDPELMVIWIKIEFILEKCLASIFLFELTYHVLHLHSIVSTRQHYKGAWCWPVKETREIIVHLVSTTNECFAHFGLSRNKVIFPVFDFV